MTSNLSGGTNALINYSVVKSSSSTLTSPASSHSSASTISEASNASQSTIRTKKPRATRKRPNQTYNEAAMLLSKANPSLFRNLKKPCKFTKPITERNDSSEPLLLFRACDNDAATSFVIQNKSTYQTEFFSVREKLCSGEVISSGVVNSDELEHDSGEDFDCQSILDEEIEEGIDSIMGSRVEDGGGNGGGRGSLYRGGEGGSSCFGRFGGKFGWAGALRHVDGGNCWNFAVVDVFEISPGMKNTSAAVSVPATEREDKKKRRKKENVELRDLSQVLRLKLNYNDVRNAWSDRGSPFLNNRNMTSLDVSHIPTEKKKTINDI